MPKCINCDVETKEGAKFYCEVCNGALTRIRQSRGWPDGPTADEHHGKRWPRLSAMGTPPRSADPMPVGQKFYVTMRRSNPSAFMPTSYLIEIRVEVSARYARYLCERADTENDFCTMVEEAIRDRLRRDLDFDYAQFEPFDG